MIKKFTTTVLVLIILSLALIISKQTGLINISFSSMRKNISHFVVTKISYYKIHWITYDNNEYGYSIKYPENVRFFTQNNSRAIKFWLADAFVNYPVGSGDSYDEKNFNNGKSRFYFTIVSRKASPGLSLDKLHEEILGGEQIYKPNVADKKITINGEDAYYFEYSWGFGPATSVYPFNYVSIYMIHNGIEYNITGLKAPDESKGKYNEPMIEFTDQYESIFNKMLSSFKFIPVSKVSIPVNSKSDVKVVEEYECENSKLDKPLLKVPFTFQEFFKGEISELSDVKTEYGLLSFPLLTDPEHFGSRNPSYGIMLDNQQLGETGGQGFSLISFSPDKKYYAFRSRGTVGCAGTCQDFYIHVVDLMNKKILFIKYPNNGYDLNNVDFPKTIIMSSNSEYIESYSWETNNVIKLTTFLVSLGPCGENRITPKQVWRHDIQTKGFEYELVE